MASHPTKKSVSVSLIVGTLLVPLSAVATVWLSDTVAEAEAPLSQPTASTPVDVVPMAIPSPDATPNAADFEAACGAEGMGLVALESSGAITDVQQAALDALRPLCDQHGLALPAPPVPEPIVQTVVTPAASLATSTVATFDDDREDDDHWDDDREDDDDDHWDDDHEDDDHDDDDDDDRWDDD